MAENCVEMQQEQDSDDSAMEQSDNIEYSSEAELMSEFYSYMSDPANVEAATNYLYQSLLDDAILGVVFEIHYQFKTGIIDAIEGIPEDNEAYNILDTPDYDVFGSGTAKKQFECNCPNCDRLVAASKFAPHLEKCMGMGRNSSRIASRRLANRNSTGSYFGTNLSDDEDDVDWSSERRRKKIQTPQRNGSKKNGKSS